MDKHEINQQIGRRIQAIRKRNGLSQDRLADAIDKSVETISNIERGISAPRVGTAVDIATALNVTLAELFKVSLDNPAETRHTEVMEQITELTKDCDEKALNAVVEAVELVIRLSDKKPTE